jgi:hypothetical protein
MEKHTRRQWLGGMLLLTITAPFRNLYAAQTPGEKEDARRIGLSAARIINTAQSAFSKRNGRFGSLDEIAASPVVEELSKVYDAAVFKQIRFASDVAPNFRAVLNLSDDRKAYTLIVAENKVSDGRAFAYRTDQKGVILVGSVASTGKRMDLESFVGEPLKRPGRAPKRPLSSIAAAITSLVVPTLHAQPDEEGGCGLCAACWDDDAESCGTNCSVLCCNTGWEPPCS